MFDKSFYILKLNCRGRLRRRIVQHIGHESKYGTCFFWWSGVIRPAGRFGTCVFSDRLGPFGLVQRTINWTSWWSFHYSISSSFRRHRFAFFTVFSLLHFWVLPLFSCPLVLFSQNMKNINIKILSLRNR